MLVCGDSAKIIDVGNGNKQDAFATTQQVSKQKQQLQCLSSNKVSHKLIDKK